MSKIKVIARNSKLSQLQVKEIFDMFPEIPYELQLLSSYGDKNKAISLLDGEAPPDIFTRGLDDILINGDADIAIHSAKDLPYPLTSGLKIIALFKAFDTTDSLVSRRHLKLNELPSGSIVGTSSSMRKTELLAVRPDLIVKSIRGCIEERIQQLREGKFDAIIVATCALKRLGIEEIISEILPFETHPLQGYLAITAKADRLDLDTLFNKENILAKQGNVTLVGFGPGDPDLLTIAAVKAINRADIIFYDDLIDKNYLHKIHAEKVYVGKRFGKHHIEQHEINRLLLEMARAGKNVVRLKGGDPMIFAHAGEEIEFLQRNLIKVHVIPGITAASAMAAAMKVSLTQRAISSSVAFINGYSNTPIVPQTDTAVYYMGASHLQSIAEAWLKEGYASNTPVLLVHNVSLGDEKSYKTTISELAKEEQTVYPTPLIALFGDVVSLRSCPADKIKRTLYTGTKTDNPNYIHTPLIEIKPCINNCLLEEAVSEVSSYDFLLFTSQYAVKYWFKALREQGCHMGDDIKIISIGETTSRALQKEGRVNVVQPTIDNSYGVLSYFEQQKVGKRILFPRSDKGLSIIPEGLKKMGYEVKIITVYNNCFPSNPKKVNLDNIQKIIFTSPSTVDNFIKVYGSLPKDKEYETRGIITAEYLKKKI